MYNTAYSESIDTFHDGLPGKHIDSYIIDTCKYFFKPSKDVKLAELGCNQGILLKKMLDYYDCFGYDILNPDQLKDESVKNVYQFADFNKPLQIESNTYDLLVSSNVLEHIQNIDILASEAFRILKHNGTFINIVPFEPSGFRGISNLRTTWHEHSKEGFYNIVKMSRYYHTRSFRLHMKLFNDEILVDEFAKMGNFRVDWEHTGIRFLYAPWISIVLIKP